MYPGPTPPGQTSAVSIGNGLRWAHVDEFTLLQAACLWAEIEPLNSFQDLPRSPEATARYQMLVRAIEAGDLEAGHQTEQDLIAMALLSWSKLDGHPASYHPRERRTSCSSSPTQSFAIDQRPCQPSA
jgi:hypothetical protein